MRRNGICCRRLTRLLPRYPDINVELTVDYGLTDIVAERFDAGVRLGEQVAKDMIAVPIGPHMRMAVVGAPAYFAKHGTPKTPRRAGRSCLHQSAASHPRRTLRLGIRERRAELNVRVEGQLCLQHVAGLIVKAALAGMGLASLPQDTCAGRDRQRAAGAGAGGLVPALSRLSPLLSQPPPAIAGASRCWSKRCAIAVRAKARRGVRSSGCHNAWPRPW